MFCEVTDIVIPWKKITRGLPKGECMQMIEHPIWKRSIKSSNILIEE
jgi:hypothetical protein